MPVSRLIVDIAGLELTAEDREVLTHPTVAGVILFSRNYSDPLQLTELTTQIHALRSPSLQISVDQEGGRVCRFRSPFPRLPSAREVAVLFKQETSLGLELASCLGWIIGSSLRSLGVDLSYTPVLDLDYDMSDVIGDRSFGRDPQVVTSLAEAVINGLMSVSMPAVGKHFPGHGAVKADSHLELPVDYRSLPELLTDDLIPFSALFAKGLNAIMTAHVTYPEVDLLPVTFSEVWIQEILRGKLGFSGLVFSDDLSMHATAGFGDMRARYQQAVEVGCDRVLICNDRVGVCSVLDQRSVQSPCRLIQAAVLNAEVSGRYQGQPGSLGGWPMLSQSMQWHERVNRMSELLARVSGSYREDLD